MAEERDMRIEKDSLGKMLVPTDALYGPQTARAVENFPISRWRMPVAFIQTLAAIKECAAGTNARLDLLPQEMSERIAEACGEIIAGKHTDQFPVDVFQTGSGTSTNMNLNEVIANLANRPDEDGEEPEKPVHPNDHVNMGQSSNDVIPTAIHVSAAWGINDGLLPAIQALRAALEEKAAEFDDIVKVGRTHLQDAVPIRLGQEFGGYAAALEKCLAHLADAVDCLCDLPIGGTAVGTGLNTDPTFAEGVCGMLSKRIGLEFREAENHFAAQTSLDAVLHAAGACKITAITLGKIANDIRLLASGPRCGLGELSLPAVQPGSSIMPGKVNPVICESVIQVGCQVVGHEAAIAAGATGGVGAILELNMCLPMIAWNLLTAIGLLATVCETFRVKCVEGLTANRERCEELVERSLAMVTPLAPVIGYDAAAEIAKEAAATGRTIREVAAERKVVPPEELERLLDSRAQTGN